MKKLNMFQTGIIQDAYDKDQNQGSNSQIDICFHDLFPPQVNKIKDKQSYTANDCGEKIRVGNIPFNHASSSLANANEIEKNTPVITIAMHRVSRKLSIYCPRRSKGETTPTVNQATAALPKISEALSSWPEDNFIIAINSSMDAEVVSRNGKIAVLK